MRRAISTMMLFSAVFAQSICEETCKIRGANNSFVSCDRQTEDCGECVEQTGEEFICFTMCTANTTATRCETNATEDTNLELQLEAPAPVGIDQEASIELEQDTQADDSEDGPSVVLLTASVGAGVFIFGSGVVIGVSIARRKAEREEYRNSSVVIDLSPVSTRSIQTSTQTYSSGRTTEPSQFVI